MVHIFGINYLKEHFTHQQRYIVVAVLALFLPFIWSSPIYALLVIRLLWTGEIQEAYQKTPHSHCVIYFCSLTFVVSLIYQNYIGAVVTLGILAFFSFAIYYRQHITEELFNFSTNLIIVFSILAAIYGLIEYVSVLSAMPDITQFEVIIFNAPQDRINSVYFNANYYAMMIEFFVCICVYKILRVQNYKAEWKKVTYYIAVIALNLFMLVLTACRTAWPTLAVMLLIMLILDRRYKACAVIFIGILGVFIYFIINPTKFPRFDNIISYFFTRTDIWDVAILNIKKHPLFGEGPMTYMHIYELYDGHPTQHAHSVYLDPLLCYGVVGITTLIPFIVSKFKDIIKLYKLKIDRPLIALIFGFIVIVLVHGTLDYTIFFVPTGMLFFFMTYSYEIYRDKLKDK